MVEGKYFYFRKFCTLAHFSDSSHAVRHQIVLVDDVSLQLLRPYPCLMSQLRTSGPPPSESEEFSPSDHHWVIWGQFYYNNLVFTVLSLGSECRCVGRAGPAPDMTRQSAPESESHTGAQPGHVTSCLSILTQHSPAHCDQQWVQSVCSTLGPTCYTWTFTCATLTILIVLIKYLP